MTPLTTQCLGATTWTDYINAHAAATSKEPAALFTPYADDLMLVGGGRAVLKILKEKLMSRSAVRTWETSH